MKFSYKALKNGKIVNGKIEADNRQKLIEFLKNKEFLIIDVAEEKKILSALSDTFFSRVTFTDIVDFTRQLAIMINAGLTIIDSLDILKRQAIKPSILKLINSIDEEVRAGNSLSQALKKHPNLFNNLYISLIRAGEASGKLDEILLRLSDNLEKEREFRGKIKGALIYPVIVVTGMIAVMFILITFVVPKLLDLYKDFNIALPLSTQILIAVSSFFQRYWPIIILTVFLAFVGIRNYFRTKIGKKMRDLLVLKIPLVKRVIKVSVLTDSTRTLSILIGSGVSILDALDIIVDTAGNVVFQEAFQKIHSRIEKGDSLGRALEQAEIFPPILVQMATVGEQTGHLDETLLRISRYFESESELAIKAMTTLIEPIILVFLGIGVGSIVIAIITPIYNLTSSIK